MVDAKSVAKRLRLKRVGLINDLVANAYGIALLRGKDFVTLNKGARKRTGQPGAHLRRHRPRRGGPALGREGAPSVRVGGGACRLRPPQPPRGGTARRYLLKRDGRVSYERLVSGPGLVNATASSGSGEGRGAALARGGVARRGPGCRNLRNALEGKSPLCLQALDLFVSAYGAAAGNLALTLMATGGVYLGGGIAPKIVAKLKEPGFMNAFTAKGRLRPLLEDTPVRVIMNPKTALLGAARHAALGLGD